ARGVDDAQLTLLSAPHHVRRDTVSGEDDARALRHLLDRVDEDGAALPEAVHHVAVVHDLVERVDRRLLALEDLVQYVDRPHDARAEASRRREQQGMWHATTLRSIQCTEAVGELRPCYTVGLRPPPSTRTVVTPASAPTAKVSATTQPRRS